MKNTILNAMLAIVALTFTNCRDREVAVSETAPVYNEEQKIARGKYLVTTTMCHDCHSPKIMTPEGPVLDSARLLSGHPQDEPIPPVVLTKDWVLFSGGLTAVVGPWGVSFSANLTPDETGIGNWKFEQFRTALRKGKYKGLEQGRPLLPPMPWEMVGQMSDEDLEAMFLYLKSIQPVKNLVPAPIPPDRLQSLANNSK
jgi:hypothetical protein